MRTCILNYLKSTNEGCSSLCRELAYLNSSAIPMPLAKLLITLYFDRASIL